MSVLFHTLFLGDNMHLKKTFVLVLVVFLLIFSFCSCQKNTGQGGDDITKLDFDYLDEYDYGAGVESKIKFAVPLHGEITSEFGPRVHPITGKDSFHTGIDIGVPEGTRVNASAGGIVTEAGNSDIYGNFVKIKHDDTYVTFYAHCSEITVETGTVVRQGECVALSGNSGRYTTGPHLHFEVQQNGESVNPRPFVHVNGDAF